MGSIHIGESFSCLYCEWKRPDPVFIHRRQACTSRYMKRSGKRLQKGIINSFYLATRWPSRLLRMPTPISILTMKHLFSSLTHNWPCFLGDNNIHGYMNDQEASYLKQDYLRTSVTAFEAEMTGKKPSYNAITPLQTSSACGITRQCPPSPWSSKSLSKS